MTTGFVRAARAADAPLMAEVQAASWRAAFAGLVPESVLAELTSGRLRAALDVTDPEPLPAGHPLWDAPGLLLTPHVGGKVTDSDARAYRVVGEQLRRLAAGEPLRNVIGASGY